LKTALYSSPVINEEALSALRSWSTKNKLDEDSSQNIYVNLSPPFRVDLKEDWKLQNIQDSWLIFQHTSYPITAYIIFTEYPAPLSSEKLQTDIEETNEERGYVYKFNGENGYYFISHDREKEGEGHYFPKGHYGFLLYYMMPISSEKTSEKETWKKAANSFIKSIDVKTVPRKTNLSKFQHTRSNFFVSLPEKWNALPLEKSQDKVIFSNTINNQRILVEHYRSRPEVKISKKQYFINSLYNLEQNYKFGYMDGTPFKAGIMGQKAYGANFIYRSGRQWKKEKVYFFTDPNGKFEVKIWIQDKKDDFKNNFPETKKLLRLFTFKE